MELQLDERHLEGLDCGLGQQMNVIMERSEDRERHPDASDAIVQFVAGPVNFSLVALPFDSLRKLAAFIVETLDEYEAMGKHNGTASEPFDPTRDSAERG